MAKKEVEKNPSEQIKEIKKQGWVKKSGKEKGIEHTLIYDAFGEGLEPSYYWVLEFMRTDLGLDVEKTADYFAAAEASSYYGELSMRRAGLEKRVGEIMLTLNAIVKSIINLLWDLKEFDMRLDSYKKFKKGAAKEKEEADQALKAVWLTDVDVKKGRAAINVLTNDLNFVTLRDAFMVATSPSDVDKMDLNDRVKRVLKPRIAEYLNWVELSGKELEMRRKVELAYLKSQVSALKLQTHWVKPYLIAINKLRPPVEVAEPEEIVTAFDVARIYISLLGTKEVAELPRPGTYPIKVKPTRDEDKVFQCVIAEFIFRSSPAGIVERGHYTQRGKVKMIFKPYVFTKAQLDKLKALEEDEILQFAEGVTKESLDAMHEDLKKYLEEKPEAKKEEFEIPLFKPIKDIVSGMIEPFKGIAEGIKFLTAPSKKAGGKAEKKPSALEKHQLERLKEAAKEKAEKACWNVFEKYKKTYKMITW